MVVVRDSVTKIRKGEGLFSKMARDIFLAKSDFFHRFFEDIAGQFYIGLQDVTPGGGFKVAQKCHVLFE